MAKILIVEDEPVLLEIYKDSFKKAGMEVVTAQGGKAGIIEAVKQKPDLILLDLMLPEMSGTTALEHLKEMPETKDIPVVIASVVPEEVPQKLDGKEVFNTVVAYFRKDQNNPDQIVEGVKKILISRGQLKA